MVEGEWEKIRVNVDSGAVDWVTNKETARAFDVKPTKLRRTGEDIEQRTRRTGHP